MASGDILDFLTNNWSTLLGGGAGPGAGVAPQPPQWAMPAPAPSGGPSTMATAQQYSPSGVMDVNPITGQPPQIAPPAPTPPGSLTPDEQAAAIAGGVVPPTGPVQPPSGGPAAAPPPPGAPPQDTSTAALQTVPLPQPRPPGAPQPPGAPLNIAPDPNQFLPPNSTSTTSAPPPSTPPMNMRTVTPMVSPNPGGAQPPGGGGLAAALGINPSSLKTTLAGIGGGLTAAGNMRPGTNAGQAFATGAGGALTAADKAQDTLFNQSSTAFKDMMAAKAQDNTEGYRSAQANYLNARANSIKLGGTGSGAWQATPYGKVIQVENEAQKYEKGQQILLQKRWSLNGSSPEQQQKDLDDLNTRTTAYRAKLYQSAGINPSDGQKMKDWGTTQDNPFSTKGMTLDQFNQQVPMGAWFTDQNGTVRQRTVPPAGNQPPQSQSSTQPNPDDQAAMQPAA